jgi:hypothetical protein
VPSGGGGDVAVVLCVGRQGNNGEESHQHGCVELQEAMSWLGGLNAEETFRLACCHGNERRRPGIYASAWAIGRMLGRIGNEAEK